MKNFILDEKPKMSEANVSLDGFQYKLKIINGNGCYLTVFQNIDGVDMERDHLSFTRTDMKALFMLLCTEKK